MCVVKNMFYWKNKYLNALTSGFKVAILMSALTFFNSQNSTNTSNNNEEFFPDYGFTPDQFPIYDTNTINPPKHLNSVPINTPIIKITNFQDFLKWNIPGEGTANNPFVIENFQLSDESNTLIQIKDTTAHVIIKNNNLNGITVSPLAYQYGIHIVNSQNVVIQNNIIADNLIKFVEYGVTILGGSNNNEINNNIFENIKYFGIYMTSASKIEETTNIAVKNNQLSDVKVGIYGIGLTNSLISNNVIQAFEYGIILDSSSYNIIEYNLIFDSSIGIFIDSIFNLAFVSRANTIMHNFLENLKVHGLVLGINIDTYVAQNNFSHIGQYAVYILTTDSINAVIELNDFENNNDLTGNSQVYDDGTNTYFIGNY
jgi:parallel beta-helix repeat protein